MQPESNRSSTKSCKKLWIAIFSCKQLLVAIFFQLIAAIGATIYCKVRLQLSVAIFATDSWRMVAWDEFEFCANFCLLKKSNNKHWRKKDIQIKISKLKCRPFKIKFSEVMNKDKDCRYEEKFNWFYQSWRSLPAASAQSILCEKYPALLFGKTEGKAWFRLLIFDVWFYQVQLASQVSFEFWEI